MRFDVLTVFPELIEAVSNTSIIGRARENGLVEVNVIDIRDYTKNKHKKTDDYPYGGGEGMIMTAQPIMDAFLSIVKDLDYKPWVLYMSPQGKVLNQELVLKTQKHEHLIIICGHYEGIDERIIEEIVDEEISIGDYILTGGELPALVLIDSVSRFIPGVLSNENSNKNESIYNGFLEYPQYTRPYDYNGKKVPDVLMSGHHENINKWRLEQSIQRTKRKRPDLYEKYKKGKS